MTVGVAREYRDYHVAYGIATAHAQLGNIGEALRWLQSAADTGFPCAIWYERDPLLTPLRRHPEFAAFLTKLKARQEAAVTRYAR